MDEIPPTKDKDHPFNMIRLHVREAKDELSRLTTKLEEIELYLSMIREERSDVIITTPDNTMEIELYDINEGYTLNVLITNNTNEVTMPLPIGHEYEITTKDPSITKYEHIMFVSNQSPNNWNLTKE